MDLRYSKLNDNDNNKWTEKYIIEKLKGRFEDYGQDAIYLQYETDWYKSKFKKEDVGDLLDRHTFIYIFIKIKNNPNTTFCENIKKFVGITKYSIPLQNKKVYGYRNNRLVLTPLLI